MISIKYSDPIPESESHFMPSFVSILLLVCLAFGRLDAQIPEPRSSALTPWATQLEERGVRVTAGLWDIKTGTFLEGYQESRALIPASTTKAVVTYALLKSLKPESTIETEILGDFDGESTVTSDVVFKGSGDPFIVSERLWTLVQDLKAKGIRRVQGSLVFDQSAFDTQRMHPDWANTSRDTTPVILPFSVNFNREGGRLVRDPNAVARATLTKLFEDNGIRILGDDRVRTPTRKLYTLTSPPLRELVASINKFSNNFMIEMLVKRWGNGQWSEGIQRIQDFYRTQLNLSPSQIAITDGSGLSKANRLSAKTLSTILRSAWFDFEVGAEYISSLKIEGGEPFKMRHKDPELTRRLRMKSGYLNNTRSLTGYLQLKNGDIRVFAIILNGPSSEEDLWAPIERWADQ